MHFQISLSLQELQVITDWLCVRDIAEKSLNRLLRLLILKSSHQSCSVEKGVLKLEPVFNKVTGLWASNAGVFQC